MNRRNPQSPWNPADPVVISPEEYEKQVVAWLQASADSLSSFTVQHRRHLSGASGEYEFDAVAELTIFEGTRIVVLVECKRCARPVEREELLALSAKLQDVGAHKALVFATCGFQSGAIEYAQVHGIATVTFVAGAFLYETRSLGQSHPPPRWANIPAYAGIALSRSGTSITCSRIDNGRVGPLASWIASPVRGA